MSIGDLFGDDLRALFGDTAEEQSNEAGQTRGEDAPGVGAGPAGQDDLPSNQHPDGAGTLADVGDRAARPGGPGVPDEGAAGGGSIPPSAEGESAALAPSTSEAETAVRNIVGELARVAPGEVALDQPLPALGIEGLALWAVVAEVERQTARAFPDRDALAWRTPGDIVSAAQAPLA